jgi:hypothetical protein
MILLMRAAKLQSETKERYIDDLLVDSVVGQPPPE